MPRILSLTHVPSAHGMGSRRRGSVESLMYSSKTKRRHSSKEVYDSCIEIERIYQEQKRDQAHKAANAMIQSAVAPIAILLGLESPCLSERKSLIEQHKRSSDSSRATNSTVNSSLSSSPPEMSMKHSSSCSSWGMFVDISEEAHYTRHCKSEKRA